MKYFWLPFFIGLAGCATPSSHQSLDDATYNKSVEQLTRTSDQYSGFYQTFQADVTLLTSALQASMVQRKAQFLQWDAKKAQQERDRSFQEMATTTKVFLRLYTPESDYDDLGRPNSIWKIYLDHGGTRYEGKAHKVTEKFVEIKNLFPNHNRFSTAYEVTFNVPTNNIETGASLITLTSSLGSANFDFK